MSHEGLDKSLLSGGKTVSGEMAEKRNAVLAQMSDKDQAGMPRLC